jgi:hypothetical protein
VSARTSIILTLSVAVLSVAGATGGAYLGSRATIITSREAAREARLAESRTKRANVYSRFLDAAESFSFKTEAVTSAIRHSVTRAGSVKAACKQRRRGTACGVRRSLFNRQDDARADFQGALNDVYIYGSRRGVRAARRVAAALPPSVYNPDERIALDDIKQGKFAAGYSAVLDTMCAEVSPDPRPTC